jgi:hypothetical protein
VNRTNRLNKSQMKTKKIESIEEIFSGKERWKKNSERKRKIEEEKKR